MPGRRRATPTTWPWRPRPWTGCCATCRRPKAPSSSSLDADAGGVEGGHAAFTLEEVRRILPERLVGPAAAWYGITQGGNWEVVPAPVRPVGEPLARPPDIEEARALLAEARARRTQPARDDKVLTEWNAMAAATLAEVASATGLVHYGRRRRGDRRLPLGGHGRQGRLLRSWQGGRAGHLAVATDQAWLAEAAVRLSEWTGHARWRARAEHAVDALVDLFWDDADGRLLHHRSRCRGPGGAAQGVLRWRRALGQLGGVGRVAPRWRLTADPRTDDAVDRTVALARPLLERHPAALADFVAALPMVGGRAEVVVTGERPDLLAVVRARWLPDAVLAWGEDDAGPLFAGRPARPGLAYVCRAHSVRHPLTTRPPWPPSWPRWSGERSPGRPRTSTSRKATEAPADPTRSVAPLGPAHQRVPTAGGSTLHLLVLSSTREDTTVVDLATRTVMRLRVAWPEGHAPDIAAFDVVEVTLADDPERDDLAQPEALTVAGLPRHVGTLRGRRVRKLLAGWWPHPTGRSWASPDPRPPTGSSGVFDPRWRSSSPPVNPSSFAATRTARPGSASAGTATTCGSRSKTATPARALDAARRERLAARAWRLLWDSSPSTCWCLSPPTRRALLQGVRGGAAPGLTAGRAGQAQRPSLPAARSSAIAHPKATRRSPRCRVDPAEVGPRPPRAA